MRVCRWTLLLWCLYLNLGEGYGLLCGPVQTLRDSCWVRAWIRNTCLLDQSGNGVSDTQNGLKHKMGPVGTGQVVQSMLHIKAAFIKECSHDHPDLASVHPPHSTHPRTCTPHTRTHTRNPDFVEFPD